MRSGPACDCRCTLGIENDQTMNDGKDSLGDCWYLSSHDAGMECSIEEFLNKIPKT